MIVDGQPILILTEISDVKPMDGQIDWFVVNW